MPGSSDLFALAKAYLDAVVAALADTPAGAPTTQYVSPGMAAANCDQVTVHVGGPLVAPTTIPGGVLAPDHRYTVAQVNVIRLTAVVLRCCGSMGQSGEDVSAAEHEADAAQTSADVWAVWNHVNYAVRGGTLFAAPYCREFAFDAAVALAIEGGLCGWQIPMHVTLGGYRPGESS